MTVHPDFSNGALPADQLRVVQSGIFQGRPYSIRLYVPVANAWAALKAAMANRYGIAPEIAPDAGGYRDIALQEDMHVHPGLHNLNPNSTAGLAAVGHTDHGFGQCVDVIPAAAVTKLKADGQALAHEFGFYFPLPNDPNHMDRLDLTTATTGAKPLTNSNRTKDDDMPILYDVPQPVAANAKTYPRQHILVYGDGRSFPFNGGDDFIARLEAQTGPSIASDSAFVAAHIASLKATAPTVGSLNLDPKALQPLLDATAALGGKIDALPAKIDQYADGRIQS